MEKNTVLAIVLSSLVIFGFYFIQDRLSPQPEQPPAPAYIDTPPAPVIPAAPIPAPLDELTFVMPELTDDIPYERVVIETDVATIVLSNAGGNIVSFQLKHHLDAGEPVEMILSGDNDPEAFAIAFGSMDNVIAGRVQSDRRNYQVRRESNYIVEFSQIYQSPSAVPFTITKRYVFNPNEYMFELTVILDSGHSMNSFNYNGAGYTLMFSPQIGPRFDKLDQRYEYRRYLTYRGKLSTERVNERAPTIISSQPSWAAIAGKYFTLAALPLTNQFELAFAAHQESGLPAGSRLYIMRPAVNSSRIEDRYLFYLGPKNEQNLSIYEREYNNAFGQREVGLVALSDTRGFLAPLERGLKWLLTVFHRLIPNYGVAILLVTLVVRLIMFPLTKKGSEATIRMQALAPKIKEIQERNKGNSQKMNAEMAEFYKREGYNPLSGCLPMLLQLPIFFAMYNLFNSHFELRGAMFIPGWIPDLSRPESILDFPEGFSLPFLGWTALRLLPFIYVASQMLYGKVVQTPTQQGGAQMKIMLYAMPIMFFFILYDVPSGLLIYWITSNVLTLVQQVILNKYMIRKKALAPVVQESKPVIAPPGGGSKKKKKNR